MMHWKAREFERFFGTGPDTPRIQYQKTVWYHADWHTGSDTGDIARFAGKFDHFPHVSLHSPEMIAYTPSDEYGAADRQVQIKPGRYLAKFFSDVLTPQQIADFAAEHRVKYANGKTMHITRDGDEIEHVFSNGPWSCMAHELSDYRSAPIHPTRAYADSDLAIAYSKDAEGKITARCVIWPEERIHSVIYGDATHLRPELEKLGYAKNDLTGARLKKIEVTYQSELRFVCPWIDGEHGIKVHENCLEITETESAELSGQTQSGFCREQEYSTCQRCEERVYDNDDMYTTVDDYELCSDCYDYETHTCFGCHDRYGSDSDMTMIAGCELVCSTCLHEHFIECEQCHDYHLADNVGIIQVLEYVRGRDTDTEVNRSSLYLCQDCASELHSCNNPPDDDEEYLHVEACRCIDEKERECA